MIWIFGLLLFICGGPQFFNAATQHKRYIGQVWRKKNPQLICISWIVSTTHTDNFGLFVVQLNARLRISCPISRLCLIDVSYKLLDHRYLIVVWHISHIKPHGTVKHWLIRVGHRSIHSSAAAHHFKGNWKTDNIEFTIDFI